MAFYVSDVQSWIDGTLVNGEALGERLGEVRGERLAELAGARPGDIAFFFSKTFEKDVAVATPSILIVGHPFVEPLRQAKLPCWSESAILACDQPYWAMARVSEKFARLNSVERFPDRKAKTEVHPTAVVAEGVELGEGAWIGPHVVIEEGAVLGAGVVIHAGCTLGPRVRIGDETVLFSGVRIYANSEIGARGRIHAGVVIGADGFGYAPLIRDGRPVSHQKIYHFGRVVIGDDVEIGANACVDRGTFGDTVIENQVKLDNLVQVGHNVHLYEGAIVCGDAALAGSSSVGRFAYVAGISGISNRVHVGDGAKVAAATLVSKDVPPGETVAGNPQRTYREHFKVQALMNQLLRSKDRDRKKGSR